MTEITGASMWIIVAIVLTVVVMIIFFMMLSGFGPGNIFDLFQGFMAMVAGYLISQLHAILR